ncbi:unnamed protein product [Sphagnum tenellum]
MGCKDCRLPWPRTNAIPIPATWPTTSRSSRSMRDTGFLTRKRFRFPGFGFLLLPKDAGNVDYKKILKNDDREVGRQDEEVKRHS